MVITPACATLKTEEVKTPAGEVEARSILLPSLQDARTSVYVQRSKRIPGENRARNNLIAKIN
jgi:hypothetical protein